MVKDKVIKIENLRSISNNEISPQRDTILDSSEDNFDWDWWIFDKGWLRTKK